MSIESCRPAAPVAPWLGGKKQLARRLIDRISTIEHDTYAEPFVGMGGIFLRRPYRPKCEVANDLNGEIINLFRILQRHYPQFIEVMRFQITSRAEFERLRRSDPATLTDLERAARFLYLQRLAFGGRIGGVFGVTSDRASRFDITRLGPLLEAAHERLAGVVLECLDWADLIARYDSPTTLFYLDPPYRGGEEDYGKDMFRSVDYARLARILAGIHGRFLLSINDTPVIRQQFASFHIEEVRVTYTVSRASAEDAAELIIADRPPPSDLFSTPA